MALLAPRTRVDIYYIHQSRLSRIIGQKKPRFFSFFDDRFLILLESLPIAKLSHGYYYSIFINAREFLPKKGFLKKDGFSVRKFDFLSLSLLRLEFFSMPLPPRRPDA